MDYKGNVWIGGNGRGKPPGGARTNQQQDESQAGLGGYFNDDMVLKFTQDGKFLMQIGKPGQTKGSNDIANLRLPAKTFVDKETNELYVADGYGNHRVIVFDADTGAYKRHWGAYGHKPDDANLGRYDPNAPPAQQFRNPVHCADLSVDRMLYVCDRANDRLQVFKPDGTFVKEMFYEKQTLGSGSAWDIAFFQKTPQQKFIYLTDGENDKVHIVQRDTLEMLDPASAKADGSRVSSTVCTASLLIRRATFSPPRLIAGSACRSSPTRGWLRSPRRTRACCGLNRSDFVGRTPSSAPDPWPGLLGCEESSHNDHHSPSQSHAARPLAVDQPGPYRIDDRLDQQETGRLHGRHSSQTPREGSVGQPDLENAEIEHHQQIACGNVRYRYRGRQARRERDQIPGDYRGNCSIICSCLFTDPPKSSEGQSPRYAGDTRSQYVPACRVWSGRDHIFGAEQQQDDAASDGRN